MLRAACLVVDEIEPVEWIEKKIEEKAVNPYDLGHCKKEASAKDKRWHGRKNQKKGPRIHSHPLDLCYSGRGERI